MGFVVSAQTLNRLLAELSENYRLLAPRRFQGGGACSDTDCIRYGEISAVEEIIFEEKSQYSFKEALLPIVQTLFFFTKSIIKETETQKKKIMIFLRSCDLHALRQHGNQSQ